MVSFFVVSLVVQSSLKAPMKPWEIHDILSMKHTGLLVGYPDGVGMRNEWTPSRYEGAVAVRATVAHIDSILNGLGKVIASSPRMTPELTQELSSLPTWRGNLLTLRALAKDFKPELRELGVDTKKFAHEVHGFLPRTQKFSKLLPQFSDVPAGNWAAKATLELRQAGILNGYPDGVGMRTEWTPSPYDGAVAIHATVIHIDNILNGLGEEANSFSEPSPEVNRVVVRPPVLKGRRVDL